GVKVGIAGNVQFQQVQVINGNVIINGGPGGNTSDLPVLEDAQGKRFQLVGMPQRGLQINNNVVATQMTLVFRPPQGAGEAARLVLTGTRPVTVPVQFAFRDVPLP